MAPRPLTGTGDYAGLITTGNTSSMGACQRRPRGMAPVPGPGVPVPDQEFHAVGLVPEARQQGMGLLGRPLPRRVSRDPGQAHAPGPVPGGEPHVQAAQEHGTGVEEISREDRVMAWVSGTPARLALD